MSKTLTALAGAMLLLGASLAQAEVVTLSDTAADGVTAGGSFGDSNTFGNVGNGSFNGFNDNGSGGNGNGNS